MTLNVARDNGGALALPSAAAAPVARGARGTGGRRARAGAAAAEAAAAARELARRAAGGVAGAALLRALQRRAGARVQLPAGGALRRQARWEEAEEGSTGDALLYVQAEVSGCAATRHAMAFCSCRILLLRTAVSALLRLAHHDGHAREHAASRA